MMMMWSEKIMCPYQAEIGSFKVFCVSIVKQTVLRMMWNVWKLNF